MEKYIIFGFAMFVILGILAMNANRWAISMQKNYVQDALVKYGNPRGWNNPARLNLFKALFWFFGLIVALTVYSFIFNP